MTGRNNWLARVAKTSFALDLEQGAGMAGKNRIEAGV